MKSKNDFRGIFLLSMFLILLTTFPYFLGYELETDERVFSGLVIALEDGNSYIAKMLRGANGDWLFYSPYAFPTSKGLIALLPYTLLGKLAGGEAIHIQLVAIFHIFRISGILFLVYSVYVFASLFLIKRSEINTAILLSLLGGGAGWLVFLLGDPYLAVHPPLFFYSPETFGFLKILSLPHLCFSQGFMLMSFTHFHFLMENQKKKEKVLAGLFLFAAGIFQPINVLIGLIIISIWMITHYVRHDFNLKIIRNSVPTLLIPLPVLLYYFFISQYDFYFSRWGERNILTSPPLVDYMFGYGPAVFFLIVFYFAAKPDRLYLKRILSSQKFSLVLWVLVLPVLIYLPFYFQRRMADGVWVALSILLASVIQRLGKSIKILILSMSVLSAGIFYIFTIHNIITQKPPVFLDNEVIALFDFLDEHTYSNDVVIASYEISNPLPAWVNVYAPLGHSVESVDRELIIDLVEPNRVGRFSDDEIRNILNVFPVDFFIFDKVDLENSFFSIDDSSIDITQFKDFIILETGYDQSSENQ